MKTKIAKNLLKKAILEIANDFCLTEAKNCISQAIKKIEIVEDKRKKRKTSSQKRKEERKKIKYHKDSIEIIEALIEKEKEKYE